MAADVKWQRREGSGGYSPVGCHAMYHFFEYNPARIFSARETRTGKSTRIMGAWRRDAPNPRYRFTGEKFEWKEKEQEEQKRGGEELRTMGIGSEDISGGEAAEVKMAAEVR